MAILNLAWKKVVSFYRSTIEGRIPLPENLPPFDYPRTFENVNILIVITLVVTHLLYFIFLYKFIFTDKVDYFMYTRAIHVNDIPVGTYKYLITIYTNWRPGSGTDAKVFIQLNGYFGQNTICYYLHNPYFPFRRLFQWGDISWFLLHTSNPIGELQAVTIGHDNSGDGPAWHLTKIIVKDLQMKKSWTFIANCWVTEGDLYQHPEGRCKLYLTPIDPDYVEPLGERAFEWARRVYRERPLSSAFYLNLLTKLNRANRLTITFVYTLTLMLTNIAYFHSHTNSKSIGKKIGGVIVKSLMAYSTLIMSQIILRSDFYSCRYPSPKQHLSRFIVTILLYIVCFMEVFLIIWYSTKFEIRDASRWLQYFLMGLVFSELGIALFITGFKSFTYAFFAKDPVADEALNVQLTERLTTSKPILHENNKNN